MPFDSKAVHPLHIQWVWFSPNYNENRWGFALQCYFILGSSFGSYNECRHTPKPNTTLIPDLVPQVYGLIPTTLKLDIVHIQTLSAPSPPALPWPAALATVSLHQCSSLVPGTWCGHHSAQLEEQRARERGRRQGRERGEKGKEGERRRVWDVCKHVCGDIKCPNLSAVSRLVFDSVPLAQSPHSDCLWIVISHANHMSITCKSQDHFHQITIWYVPFCSVVHSLPGWPLYPLPLEQLPWHHFQKGVSALIPVTPVSASFWPHFQLLTDGPHTDCGSCHHTAELFRWGERGADFVAWSSSMNKFGIYGSSQKLRGGGGKPY